VIGSYERAFYGNQAPLILPLLEKHGIQLWMPEVGGPVTSGHDELVALLGIPAKREIIRARARTTGAMTALARDYGRYVGGRPAYGYRLVAVGPHPKRQHAQWGRQLLCLEPNPETAPVVVWIFQMRLDGHTMARTVRALNDAAIPCPSASDPQRNRHRPGTALQIPTVQAILADPVYTGHAVWKRTYAEHELVDEDNLALGFAQHVRRNAPDQWVISIRLAHEALVSEEQFVTVQAIHSPRQDQVHRLPVHRDLAVRRMRPTDGRNLEQRGCRLPLPIREYECDEPQGPGDRCLHPRVALARPDAAAAPQTHPGPRNSDDGRDKNGCPWPSPARCHIKDRNPNPR
jgi:hypothetical protein